VADNENERLKGLLGLGATLPAASTGFGARGALGSLGDPNPSTGGTFGAQPLDPYVGALSKIFSQYPSRFEARYFQRQRVSLDGYHFVRCRFDDCELVTTKATFKIENCVFGTCTLTILGEALNAVKLFNVFSRDAFQRENAYFCPTYDSSTRSYSIG
jgi:hypothetical protein